MYLNTIPNVIAVLPIKWFKNIKISKCMNNGVNQSDVCIVYYSNNVLDNPDFSIPLSVRFDDNVPGVYPGQIYAFFGKIYTNNILKIHMLSQYFDFIFFR